MWNLLGTENLRWHMYKGYEAKDKLYFFLFSVLIFCFIFSTGSWVFVKHV